MKLEYWLHAQVAWHIPAILFKGKFSRNFKKCYYLFRKFISAALKHRFLFKKINKKDFF